MYSYWDQNYAIMLISDGKTIDMLFGQRHYIRWERES